jgi:CRP-like cAMP-binding protein
MLRLGQSKIKPSACRVFYYLLGKMDDERVVPMSQAGMVADLGYSRAMIGLALKELYELGIVSKSRGKYVISGNYIEIDV